MLLSLEQFMLHNAVCNCCICRAACNDEGKISTQEGLDAHAAVMLMPHEQCY